MPPGVRFKRLTRESVGRKVQPPSATTIAQLFVSSLPAVILELKQEDGERDR